MTGRTRKTKGGKILGLLQRLKIFKRNDNECDAVPDSKDRHAEQEPNIDSKNDSTETCEESEFDKFSHSSVSDKEEDHEHGHSSSPSNKKSSHPKNFVHNGPCYYTKIKNEVNGGSHLHIGPASNRTYNITLGGPPTSQSRPKDFVRKTPQISALFKCKDELEREHVEYLSGHLGDQWESIGKELFFSKGELNEVKKSVKKSQTTDYDKERAFKMLMKWRQLQQQSPTVGKLARTLWDTRVSSAQEAVQRLSMDIEHFQDL